MAETEPPASVSDNVTKGCRDKFYNLITPVEKSHSSKGTMRGFSGTGGGMNGTAGHVTAIKKEPKDQSNGGGGDLRQTKIEADNGNSSEDENAFLKKLRKRKRHPSWSQDADDPTAVTTAKNKKRKIYSDDLKDMCLMLCMICGKTLPHVSLKEHLAKSHQERRRESITYEYKKLTYHRCKLCGAETMFTIAAMTQHLKVFHGISFTKYKDEINAFTGIKLEIKDEPESEGEEDDRQPNGGVKQRAEQPARLGEDSANQPDNDKEEERVFSESLKDMCLCECKLCGKSVYHHQIKSHNDNLHRPAKSQYDFIRQTYYRCKVCSSEMLFSLKTIRKHVKSAHSLSLQHYRARYKAFTGQTNPTEENTAAAVHSKRQYSDCLSDMCTYKCKECGKIFTQRRIKKHLEREHKKSPTKQNYHTNRLTYYRCKICEAEMMFTYDSVKYHVKKSHQITLKHYRTHYPAFVADCKPEKPVRKPRANKKPSKEEEQRLEDGEEKVLTDQLEEMCTVSCNHCSKVVLHSSLTKHMASVHKQKESQIPGNFKYVKKTFYECKICQTELLFSFYSIRKHIKRAHQLNLKEYEEKHAAFTGQRPRKFTLNKAKPTDSPAIIESSKSANPAGAPTAESKPKKRQKRAASKSAKDNEEFSVSEQVTPAAQCASNAETAAWQPHVTASPAVPASAADDVASKAAWYDGNRFQCRKCDYATGSFYQLGEHLRDMHQVNSLDQQQNGDGNNEADVSSGHYTKTAMMYQCHICLAEIYHERAAISYHLQTAHAMDLDTYARSYVVKQEKVAASVESSSSPPPPPHAALSLPSLAGVQARNQHFQEQQEQQLYHSPYLGLYNIYDPRMHHPHPHHHHHQPFHSLTDPAVFHNGFAAPSPLNEYDAERARHFEPSFHLQGSHHFRAGFPPPPIQSSEHMYGSYEKNLQDYFARYGQHQSPVPQPPRHGGQDFERPWEHSAKAQASHMYDERGYSLAEGYPQHHQPYPHQPFF